jgi:hypothetical protein
MRDDLEEDQSLNDEVRPDQGIERYWLYVHGEEVRMLSGLAFGICLVTWCMLLVFDAGQSTPGIVILICAMSAGIVWLMLDDQLKKMSERGWRKSKRSRRTEELELGIAISLWLFV